MSACEQDLLNVDATPTIEKAPAAYIIDINDIGAGMKSTGNAVLPPQQHTMGPERDNPFTVAALDAAEITARGSLGGGGHTATDHYLKFTPQDHDDLYELEEADFFLTDYPWTREMITEGDFYQTTGSPDDFPELYTTVSVNTTLPDVPYVILAVLDLSETDPVIIKQSFEDTDNDQAYTEEFERDGIPKTHDFSNTTRSPLDEVCADPNGCGGGTTPPLVNECGCVISRDARRPGGTIKVEDTQYQSFVPVRRVRVVGKNNWFTWHRADTDDNGCWRINHRYQGRTWFWVKFKDQVSDRGRFRFAGVRGARFWQKAFTGKVYLGRMSGNNVNNIIARFGAWDGNTVGTKTHYAWAGATVNNSLHEYHDYALQEGFFAPPSVNTMVMLGRGDGFATMLRQMGLANFMNAFSDGVAIGISDQDFLQSVMAAQFNYLTGLLITTSPLNSSLVRNFVADINTGGDFTDSDEVKRLAYHEFGHASHYEGTSVSYWKDVIRAEVGAGGHGDPSSNNAALIQVVESWAEHIALTMVKQEYSVANVTPNDNTTYIGSSWAERHEIIRNESMNHIPIGLFNDLTDGVEFSENVGDEDDLELFGDPSTGVVTSSNFPTVPLRDGTGGYDNQFFTSILDDNITSIPDLLQECLDNVPPVTTANEVSALFTEY